MADVRRRRNYDRKSGTLQVKECVEPFGRTSIDYDVMKSGQEEEEEEEKENESRQFP